MEIEKKDKVKKILTRVWLGVSTFLSGLFVVAVAVGCSQKGNKQASAYYDDSEYQYSYRYDYHKEYRNTKKAVAYYDDYYQIEFSSDELNNYHWNNLITTLKQVVLEYSFDNTRFGDRNGEEYSFYDIDTGGFSLSYQWYLYDDEDENNIIEHTYNIEIRGTPNYENVIRYIVDDDESTFTQEWYVWTLNANVYSSVKSAIEQDIIDNQVPENDIVFDIFTDMTNSIVGFTASVGSGIVAMTALFYDSVNSQLTTLGLLSVIVVAVSLAYWLFRLIIGLIRMRG